MNILLIVIAGIFLICMFLGYKKGLIKIVASLLATLISIILVSLIAPHVSTWIRTATPLEDVVQSKVIEMLLPDTESEETILEQELPREQQISLIEGAEIPKMFQQMLLENNNSEAYAVLGVTTFGEYVGVYIAKLLADIIAFLVTMVVVLIVVHVAIAMLGILDKLPIIGGANRVAGAAVGIGIGFLVVWIFFLLVTLLYNTAIGKVCLDNIAASPILTKLYDSNILMKYVTKF